MFMEYVIVAPSVKVIPSVNQSLQEQPIMWKNVKFISSFDLLSTKCTQNDFVHPSRFFFFGEFEIAAALFVYFLSLFGSHWFFCLEFRSHPFSIGVILFVLLWLLFQFINEQLHTKWNGHFLLEMRSYW